MEEYIVYRNIIDVCTTGYWGKLRRLSVRSKGVKVATISNTVSSATGLPEAAHWRQTSTGTWDPGLERKYDYNSLIFSNRSSLWRLPLQLRVLRILLWYPFIIPSAIYHPSKGRHHHAQQCFIID